MKTKTYLVTVTTTLKKTYEVRDAVSDEIAMETAKNHVIDTKDYGGIFGIEVTAVEHPIKIIKKNANRKHNKKRNR